MEKLKTGKYIYGEENNLNLKLVVALRRSLLSGEKKLNTIISKYGLTESQFGVLEALYHIGEMNINEIIEKTLSTSGNMTVVIRNLVKHEFATKERDPDDGRAFVIRITQKGYELIEELFPDHLKELKSEFSTLTLEEKEQLLNLLKKMNRYQEV